MKKGAFVRLLFFSCSIASISAAIPTLNQVGPSAMPEQIAPVNAPFYMPPFERPDFGDRVVSIIDFGAKPDGQFNCRQAINAAIEACSSAGGGRVLVPAGKWFTGRIELMSKVELHLDKEAELYFSGQLEDYLPAVFCRNEGVELYSTGALIYAHEQQHIAVTGRGKIVGPPLDAPLRKLKKMKVIDQEVDAYNPVKTRIFDGQRERGHFLPYTLSPISCKDVFIESISVERSAMWNIVPIYCENVVIRGVEINSQGIPRGDGVNIESSRNVLVEYCSVNTGDDSYCFKAGRNEDGIRVRRPVENVVHRYNLSLGGHGGITCGSETAGVIRNVYIANCRYENVGVGIRFKTRRPRGGGGENMTFENLSIKADRIITWEMLGSSMYVGNLAERLPPLKFTPLTPAYRDITIRNIVGRAARSLIRAKGIPESPIMSVVIENADLTGPEGVFFVDADEVILRDCRFHCDNDLIFDLRNVQNFQTQYCTIEGVNSPKIRVAEDTSKNIDLGGIHFEKNEHPVALEVIDGADKSIVSLPEENER